LVEAGAAEVVASDRDLDDRLTAEVMALLHRHLAAGWSGAAALRQVWLESEDPRLRAAVESFQVVRQHL
jgi:CHAT domain-containing protein